MNWLEEILNVGLYGGTAIGLFLMFLLNVGKEKQLAKRVMSCLLACLIMLFLLYGWQHKVGNVPLLLMPFWLLALLALGPLIHLYVQATYRPKLSFFDYVRPYRWPIVALLVLIILGVVGIAQASSLGFFCLGGVALVAVISLWWHLLRAFRELGAYRRSLRGAYAHLGGRDLRWLTQCLRAILALLIVDLIAGVLVALQPTWAIYLGFMTWAYLAFLVYIGYHGLIQQVVLLPNYLLPATVKFPRIEKAPTEIPKESFSYFKNTAKAKEWIQKLEKLLVDEELFKQSDLSLRILAEQLQLTDKQLSELLNNHIGLSFYEYVNTYRVNAFKEKVAAGEAQQYTLLSIALECGFASKTSFNRIFKQHTGLTPGAYKKRVIIEG